MGILDVKPHQVSRDLRGYSVLLYGEPKSGKTTTASRFPKSLVLAFEKGYSAIPGIMAFPINSWGEFKKVLTELKTEAAKEMYQTIVIDTADIAYGYCEKYVCSMASDAKNTYDNIADIPFGKGYKLAQTEFDECIRKILQLDYGLVLISHAQDKVFTDEGGKEYNKIVPTLDNRAKLICERTCDIIGYSRIVATEEGEKTKLFLRGTSRFVAGSRFKHTPPVIDFNYNSLVDAIADAIDKEAADLNNAYVTNEKVQLHSDTTPDYDFPSMIEEFQDLVGKLMGKSPANAGAITAIVEKHLGKGKKVGECSEANAPQIDLILFELRAL